MKVCSYFLLLWNFYRSCYIFQLFDNYHGPHKTFKTISWAPFIMTLIHWEAWGFPFYWGDLPIGIPSQTILFIYFQLKIISIWPVEFDIVNIKTQDLYIFTYFLIERKKIEGKKWIQFLKFILGRKTQLCLKKCTTPRLGRFRRFKVGNSGLGLFEKTKAETRTIPQMDRTLIKS